MTLIELATYRSVYLATVYTCHPAGHDIAADEAAALAAELVKRGVNVYAPIVYGHQLAKKGLDATNHDLWLELDRHHMEKADALVVVKMPNWEVSRGIKQELSYFRAANKDIYFLDPQTFELEGQNNRPPVYTPRWRAWANRIQSSR